MESTRIKEIEEFIIPLLDSQQVNLVDVELSGKSGAQVLRIFVDCEGGISLDSCVKLSRQISDVLDTRDVIPGRYRLEVSSPGLDRPLKSSRDFIRNLGHQVKISYRIDSQEIWAISGTIDQVDERQVVIQTDGDRITIELPQILTAKVIQVW